MTDVQKSKRRPSDVRVGRRPGKTAAKDEILEAAERIFAARGYDGASIRRIAETAGVDQALVHHYFGAKESLLQAIYLRRGRELARSRIQRLEDLESTGAAITLEAVVRAYFEPAYELKREGPGGLAFMKLQARIGAASDEIPEALRNEVYDEPMRRFKSALSRVLPAMDAETIFWRMTFAIGAYLYAISDAHRISTVSNGLCDPHDLNASMRQLCAFIVGGLREGC